MDYYLTMNREPLEKGADMQDNPDGKSYQRYLELGGIINEQDYNDALLRLKIAQDNYEMPDKNHIGQVRMMADVAGIGLLMRTETDPRVILYSILRSDIRPKDVEHHHSQMSDWRLFAEVLRMLEDMDAFNKLKTFHHTNRRLGTYCPLCGKTEYSKDCI